MTSRERVLAAVALAEPDRIPCSYHAMELVNKRLCNKNGITNYCQLLEWIGSDMVDIRGTVDPIWVADFPKFELLESGMRRSYMGYILKKVETQFGEIEEHAGYELSKATSIDDMGKFKFPKADWFNFKDIAQSLKLFSGFCIMASGASIYQQAALVRGLDGILCDMISDEEMANYLIDKYTNFQLDYFERLFSYDDGMIDILRIADDLGMQHTQLFSLDLAKKHIFPRLKKFTELAHSYGKKVMLHSCGSIVPFIEDIIECGVDILDPIQPLATGMDLAKLKDSFGSRICFHGSIDTQYTLPRGTAEEVKKEVFSRMSIFGKSGGFIVAPSHILQPDVPDENIMALYQGVKEYNSEIKCDFT